MANTTVNKVVLGSETLIDLTDTTATASDVASGKVFYTASGAKATGTASGGITPTGTISITANGTYDVTQYASADVNVPSGGSSDPYPVRNDGYSHLWVVVDDLSRPDFSIRAAVSGHSTDERAARIDWGDGTVDVINSTNNTKLKSARGIVHSYGAVGTYEIVISDGTQYHFSWSYASAFVGTSPKTAYLANAGKLRAIEFGVGATAATSGPHGMSFFSCCLSLEKITYAHHDTWVFEGLRNTRYKFNVTDSSLLKDKYHSLWSLRTFDTNGSAVNCKYIDAFYDCFSLTGIDLSTATISISTNMFRGCLALADVNLPSTMDHVGTSMFDGCKSLRTIDLPAAVASVGESSFNDCWSLQSVTIPAAVTTIGANAFANCYSLASITFLPTTPPTVDDASAWANLPTTCVIHVPAGTLADYTAAANYPDPATYTYVED